MTGADSAPSQTPLQVHLTALSCADGTTIPLRPGATVVFVGPNNAGKSLLLRELHEWLTEQTLTPKRILTEIGCDNVADMEHVEEWLRGHCRRDERSGGPLYRRYGAQVHESNVVTFWHRGPRFGPLGNMFTLYAPPAVGVQWAGPAGTFNYHDEPPTHPLHHLFLDGALEERLSGLCRDAFGEGLVLTRIGQQIQLLVGDPPPGGITGPPSKDYTDALIAMPALANQGDGMKAFVGLLLYLTAADSFWVLVDEPDAFLHPPQAYLLGRLLVQEKSPATQLFVATHDTDLLRGLLDAPESDVTVVRLRRTTRGTALAVLSPDRLRDLWSDPLLRYSSVLDGLFHQATVVCEGDADCRYYASVLDNTPEWHGVRSELHFTHGSTVSRMATIIRSLTAVDVPVVGIADFDALREETTLRPLVEALGGHWDAIAPGWRQVKAALDADPRSPQVAYVRAEVNKVLDQAAGPYLSRQDIARYKQLVKGDDRWEAAKRTGLAAVPHGDAHRLAEEMLEALAGLGLFVVPSGELESLVPDVGGHGPAWVAEVHAHGWHADEHSAAARSFLTQVATKALALARRDPVS
jgi:hypothetical protein